MDLRGTDPARGASYRRFAAGEGEMRILCGNLAAADAPREMVIGLVEQLCKISPRAASMGQRKECLREIVNCARERGGGHFSLACDNGMTH